MWCRGNAIAGNGKGLSFESGRDLFFCKLEFCAFSDYRLSVYFCRLSFRSPIVFEGIASFQVAATPMFEMINPGSSIRVETCFFCKQIFVCLLNFFGIVPLKQSCFETLAFFREFRELFEIFVKVQIILFSKIFFSFCLFIVIHF